MIEARLDTYTDNLLYVEEPAIAKPRISSACLACGTEQIVKLSDFPTCELDGRSVGPTGLSLATALIGTVWFQAPGGSGTARQEMRSKSIPMDKIILGLTTSIMLCTIAFILGWEIALITGVAWGCKAYIEFSGTGRVKHVKTEKEQQRMWDRYVEKQALERRKTAWSNMGYCRECGTVHDLKRKKFTSWYNLLELYDDFAPSETRQTSLL